MTESAIPQHLVAERTRVPRTPEGYRPPSPAFVARPSVEQRRVVMAYLGAQGGPAELPDGPDGPRHHDRAVDPRTGDAVVVAYWDDPRTFDRWFATQRDAWLDGPGGRWLEIVRPAVERYETVFGRRSRPEGVAVLAGGGDGAPDERTFGLSWWRSLADLEQWAASHPDHLQIFGSFVRMVAEQGGTRIRLYHEVSVVEPDECHFEYARCDPGTGLLTAGRAT